MWRNICDCSHQEHLGSVSALTENISNSFKVQGTFNISKFPGQEPLRLVWTILIGKKHLWLVCVMIRKHFDWLGTSVIGREHLRSKGTLEVGESYDQEHQRSINNILDCSGTCMVGQEYFWFVRNISDWWRTSDIGLVCRTETLAKNIFDWSGPPNHGLLIRKLWDWSRTSAVVQEHVYWSGTILIGE